MAAGNGRRNGLAIVFSPSLRTGTFQELFRPCVARRGCVTRYGASWPASASSEGGRSLRRSTCDAPASLRPGLPGSILSDPGIRGTLHALRLRCPPSPYRSGYASVGRLGGSGASTLSVHGLFDNGPRGAGLPPPRPSAAPPRAPPWRGGCDRGIPR